MNEELARKLIELGESGIKLASGQVQPMLQEALNYFIFESILGIIKSLAYILIPMLIIKLLGTLKSYYSTEEKKDQNILAFLGFARGVCLVVSLLLILNVGLGDAKRIGKILIAPRIFLLEEARKFIK